MIATPDARFLYFSRNSVPDFVFMTNVYGYSCFVGAPSTFSALSFSVAALASLDAFPILEYAYYEAGTILTVSPVLLAVVGYALITVDAWADISTADP